MCKFYGSYVLDYVEPLLLYVTEIQFNLQAIYGLWVIIAGFCSVISVLAVLASKR